MSLTLKTTSSSPVFSTPFRLPETELPTIFIAAGPLAFIATSLPKIPDKPQFGLTDPFINILQLNVNHSRAAHHLTFVVVADLGSDILLIQDP
ncbi:hypothetical protein TNIN_19141 [Trichonephila inaurata madagascariensis]|uniref:Uncharacterized protein n=1 Tax=Trichonephila inaurata madagascariensis TaxID=2747483 RepID=A0A8X6IR49_9ARAC|nr:hypothetical protein TNIN_19141 [Trichonephila inaurata madagascariensis]